MFFVLRHLVAVVVQLVSFTYQSITKDEFCSLTNLDSTKADALAKVSVRLRPTLHGILRQQATKARYVWHVAEPRLERHGHIL
jgi:hypothetical protein